MHFSEQFLYAPIQPTNKARNPPGFNFTTIPDDLLQFMFDLIEGQPLCETGNLGALGRRLE